MGCIIKRGYDNDGMNDVYVEHIYVSRCLCYNPVCKYKCSDCGYSMCNICLRKNTYTKYGGKKIIYCIYCENLHISFSDY